MSDKIGYSEGPLSPKGESHTLAWRDAEGFHRFYATGYETKTAARSAAATGAIKIGFHKHPWWMFWKISFQKP